MVDMMKVLEAILVQLRVFVELVKAQPAREEENPNRSQWSAHRLTTVVSYCLYCSVSHKQTPADRSRCLAAAA